MSDAAEAIAVDGDAGERKDIYEIGEIPPLGHVPEKMYAWAIRRIAHLRPRRPACSDDIV